MFFKLYFHPVHAHRPAQGVLDDREVDKEGEGHVELGDLFVGYRGESVVFKGGDKRVFSYYFTQGLWGEGANTTSQLTFLPFGPGNEESIGGIW